MMALKLTKPKKLRKKEKGSTKKFKGSGLKIVDEDDFGERSYGNQSDSDDKEAEELPQIAAVVDERPEEVKALENFRKENKWKTISSNNDEEHNSSSRDNQFQLPSVIPNRFHDSNDLPARRKRHDSDESPPRRKRHDSDESPPRRKRHDSDESPPRRKRHDSDESPPRRKRHDSDESPPRRKRHDSDESPPRRKRHDSDESPPRRKRHDSDESPPRRKRHDSDESPPRRKRHDSDESPPRRKRHDSDESPPRRKRQDSDESPPRKKHHHSDNSPPRYRHGNDHRSRNERDRQFSPSQRRQQQKRRGVAPEIIDSPANENANKTLAGKKAGLQRGDALKKEMDELRKKEDEMFAMLDDSVTGRNAETRIGAAKQRALAEEASKKEEEQRLAAERKKQYEKWGKGLKQVEDQAARVDSAVHEMSKPLARSKDDQDLDDHLRSIDRDGDPMLKFLTKKKGKANNKPMYSGPPPPPNRFHIPPGYRWDGVDRSNGYEKQWFGRINSKKALQEESYKWSVEDL